MNELYRCPCSPKTCERYSINNPCQKKCQRRVDYDALREKIAKTKRAENILNARD